MQAEDGIRDVAVTGVQTCALPICTIACAASPTSSAAPRMVTVRCSPWSRGAALLVGDAAHAIVPFFGQGMNAGFEDCTVLDEILAREPRWEHAFAELSESRRPDADAIADLALENFVEMRDKVADPEFVLWKAVEAELQRRFPGEYLSRYQLVTFTRIPYRIAQEAGRLQTSLLRDLTRDARSPSEVDYSRAHSLIHTRLTPLLQPHGLAAKHG